MRFVQSRQAPRFAGVIAIICAISPIPARSDVLNDWTDVALASAAAARQSPFVQTRTMAMVHLALFEAINGADGPYTSYLTRRRDPGHRAAVGGVAQVPERGAVAAVAAHGVLVGLFPEQKQALDAALENAQVGLDEGARGATAAEAMKVSAAVLALRADDGANAPNTVRPATSPGVYVPTALPVGFVWGKLKPWVMKSGAQFLPPPPPSLTGKVWARDYDEVKSLGGKASSARSEAQTEAARFWVVTGPPSWMQIVHDLASASGRTMVQNARLYALVSLAAADSYIAVFDAKYTYSFWRPVTAIRNGDRDENPATGCDPAWEPLIDTPMHPEYPCAHCINSGAVGRVLESEFGTGRIATFRMTSPALPGVTHSWNRIEDYLVEVANARIWGGIHYRNSAEVGTASGRKIGELVVSSILTRE